MSAEQDHPGIPLSGIHLDLTEHSITFEADHKPIAKVVFSSGTLYFQTTSQSLPEGSVAAESSTTGALAPTEESTPSEDSPTIEVRERESTIVLSGRLKSKPREGRPDGRGNPTAWARLAAHEDGEEKAHLYSTTFHRHTAKIAMGLDFNAPITVEGYRHVYDDAQRMDTLSVINFLSYPGKPEKPRS